MREPETKTVGRYELLSKVGQGANGIVYRAQDPTIRRVVALKLVPADPDATSGGGTAATGANVFEREAQAAGALLHPNIVTLYDAGRDGDWYYLAMEFIDGSTFATEIAAGPVPLERAVEVTIAVAEALDFAHQRGVVHRDIKPPNLMILKDRTVKVADFGIARLTSATQSVTADMIVGTANYMSPEQVLGERNLDGRSDLFSLGVVLYEALTGERPFQGETLATVLNQIAKASFSPPEERNPAVPADLSAIVRRAMARDRESRYARGKDLAAELRNFLRGRGGAETRVFQPVAAPHRSRRRRVAAGAMALIALIGGGMLLTLGKAPAPARGFVSVTTDAPGVEVFLEGKLLGPAPLTFEAPEGKREIEFRKKGYYSVPITVEVLPKGKTELAVPPLLARTETGEAD